MIRQPAPCRSASSRALSLPMRARIAASQSESPSARTPIAIAGPLTGHGPSAPRKARDDVRRSEREAETKPGEPVSLAERAQDDRAARRQRRREALFAIEIGEGFVDDEQSPAPRQALMQREQVAAAERSARPGCWD